MLTYDEKYIVYNNVVRKMTLCKNIEPPLTTQKALCVWSNLELSIQEDAHFFMRECLIFWLFVVWIFPSDKFVAMMIFS